MNLTEIKEKYAEEKGHMYIDWYMNILRKILCKHTYSNLPLYSKRLKVRKILGIS